MRLLVTLTTLSLAQLSVSTVPTTTSGPDCPCPPGWILAGHSCYLMSVEKRTWQDAQKVESCHVMCHVSCLV